jgi:2-polyprenyl-3-methyl-5-hydroxy-6-metoxy-1,4-benzoquinol methylase
VPALTYAIDPDALGRRYRPLVMTLDADAGTTAFVEHERARRHGRWRWAGRALSRSALGAFSANAMFDTYPLFLLSDEQWEHLLGGHRGGHLLDVGAAAGHVTTRLGAAFDDITAIDVSRPMVRRLRARGLRAHAMDLSTTQPPGGPFDALALLNVLDRCARPRTLLRAATGAVVPGGTVIVSMPLPYDPCWYDGPRTRDPLEQLGVRGESWEAGAAALAGTLEDHDLTVQAITRAPYLSGGDRHQPLYVLDAVVIVALNRSPG